MIEFLNSNFFQTIILVITILVTLFIYHLKAEGISGEAINEQQLHYSIPILKKMHAISLCFTFDASRLSPSDFAKIEQFYEVAQAVRIQQLQIKQKIQENIFAKTDHYYQQQFDRLNACVIDGRSDRETLCQTDMNYALTLYNSPMFNVMTFIHKELGSGLIKALNRYQQLTDTTVFERLSKIGKIKDK